MPALSLSNGSHHVRIPPPEPPGLPAFLRFAPVLVRSRHDGWTTALGGT